MVFFTSILIIAILYYLQADGLIYATIIALVAELINIFLTHTLTKTVENKMKLKNRRAVEGYLKRIKANKKTIRELEGLQEDAASKIYKASERIKELEAELETALENNEQVQETVPDQPEPQPQEIPQPQDKEMEDFIDHLPDGSKR